MAVTSVNLLYSGFSSTSTAQKQSYVEVYQVLLDSPNDNAANIETNSLLPFYGAFFRGNPAALCTSKSAAPDADTRLKWLVTVTYETLDKDKDDEQKDDKGKPSDDPDQWRDTWEMIGATETIPVDNAVMRTGGVRGRAEGERGPPINTAGDIFDPPPERDRSTYILRIKKHRLEYPTPFAAKYRDAVNIDTFTIRKPGFRQTFKPYQVRMLPINGVLTYHTRKDGVEIAYVLVTYDLAIREEGWRHHLLNRGFNRRQMSGDYTNNGSFLEQQAVIEEFQGNSPKAQKVRILDADGEAITTPVLLSMNGQPLDPEAPPIYIDYSSYEEWSFSLLNL